MLLKRFLQFLILGPALVLAAIAAEVIVGTSMDRMLGLPSFSNVFVNVILALFFLMGGLAIVGDCGWNLFKTGHGVPYGDVVKSLQTRFLVRTGPYRFSRNPMIMGYGFVLSSVGLSLGSTAGAILVPLMALLVLSVWIRLVEERGLEQRFGEEYRCYQQMVPFLIPMLRRRKQA